jgi:MFS family permease
MPSEARRLIFLSFVPNIAVGFMYTDLSYFLPNVQGLPGAWPGITIAVIGLTLVVMSIPLGIMADRYGRRKMLVAGNVCASLSLMGFALTTNIALILMVAMLEGIGEAAFAVSVSALVAEKAGDEKRTPAFSLLAFLGWIAGALGGFVISSVIGLQAFGLDAKEAHIVLYVVVALINLSVTPLMFTIKETAVIRRKGVLPRKSGGVLLRYLTYSVIIAVGAGLFVPLMAYWFSAAYGVTDAESGPVIGFTNLVTAFIVFMSPWLARRAGLVRATVITQGLSTIFMVAVPSAPSFEVAASVYIIRVFLMNLSNPLTQSLIMGLVSPDERGMAAGITAALWRLPNSLSSTVGYSLIIAGYLALPFYIATVLYVIGITMFWFLFKNAKLPEEVIRKRSDQIQASSLEGSDEAF